jgi:hypothetical protein
MSSKTWTPFLLVAVLAAGARGEDFLSSQQSDALQAVQSGAARLRSASALEDAKGGGRGEAAGSGEQALPSCAALNRLWLGRFRAQLKPDWPAAPLACAKSPNALSVEEIRDLDTARAAYVLDRTIWTDRSYASQPLVPGGGAEPPPNMLEWVGARIRALRYDPQAEYAHADGGDGSIHLTPGDLKLESGIGLGAQLIHESRHLGLTPYGHVVCTVGDTKGDPNCDPTIAEDFGGGGSHAIAALWLVWIAHRSRWPAADRRQAEETAQWVLKMRINDRAAADAFSMRYFARHLPPEPASPSAVVGLYVWLIARCLSGIPY